MNVPKVTPENQSIYAVDAYKPYLRKLENSDKIIEAFIQFLEQRWVLQYEHDAYESKVMVVYFWGYGLPMP